MTTKPADMDEKYFESLQNEYIKNYSKKTLLTTSKVVYSTFAQNCHKDCDQGELLLMLEKVYHPPDMKHAHYLHVEESTGLSEAE